MSYQSKFGSLFGGAASHLESKGEGPVIGVYIPEGATVSHIPSVEGYTVVGRDWCGTASMEAREAILHHVRKMIEKEEEEEREEEDFYDDYSLFAIVPEIDPYMIDSLGELPRQTGAWLTDSVENYSGEVLERVRQSFDVDRIFLSYEEFQESLR